MFLGWHNGGKRPMVHLVTWKPKTGTFRIQVKNTYLVLIAAATKNITRGLYVSFVAKATDSGPDNRAS